MFFLFLRKKKWSVFFAPFFLLIACFIIVVLLFTFPSSFWKSETEDFEEFETVDAELDDSMKIAGLRISEILESEVENVSDFYYSYDSALFYIRFGLRGRIEFSEQKYLRIKNAFKDAEEFEERIFSLEEQERFGMSGEYVFDSSVPSYESATFVDCWHTLKIHFNDEEKCFYFDIFGDCAN